MAIVVVQVGATVIEGVGVPIMARIRHPTTSDYLTQATTTSVTRKIYYRGTQVGNDAVLTVATVIFDALQTESDNAFWTLDSTGFNFNDVVDDDVFLDGDKVYRAWYHIEPSSGPKIKFAARIHTIDDPSE